MNVSGGPETHQENNEQLLFWKGSAKSLKQHSFIYCILRCRLHLLTPVCFEVKRCKKKSEGGGAQISIMFQGKGSDRSLSEPPCDLMNGQPLMLWGIKDNF